MSHNQSAYDKLSLIEDLADVTDAGNVASAGAVMDGDISQGEGFLRKTGAGAYEAIKTNLNASTDPGTGDDTGSGYEVGSRWINTTLDKEFVCLDSTGSAAVWTETTGAGGGGGINNVVEDTAPQLGGMLDVNTQAIGDGTRELLTFVEDGAAVNHIQIENEATGGGPIISSTGDDATVELNIGTKGVADINLLDNVDVTGNITLSGTVDGRDLVTDGNKLDLIEDNADVTDSANVDAAGAVMETDYNANTVLAATADDTPLPLTVTASTFVGRAASGNIAALAAGAARIVLTPTTTETGVTYAILANDYLVIADATSNSITVSLPSGPVSGQTYVVKRIDATGNTVTVDTADAALVDGAASQTVNELDSFTYVSDGTDWWII